MLEAYKNIHRRDEDEVVNPHRLGCKHPYIYPNGDCTECGVLATMFPGHCEDQHMMVARPAQILTFFMGTRPDDKGRYIGAIQTWNDEMLEGCHDQIQWMFPTPERSKYNPKAPLLTQDVIDRFNDFMRANLSLNFLRMVKFYGLEYTDSDGVKIEAPPTSKLYTMDGWDHNLLRLTRMIRSLKLLGMPNESMALFLCLAKMYTNEYKKDQPTRISRETFEWWRKAAYAGLEDFK